MIILFLPALVFLSVSVDHVQALNDVGITFENDSDSPGSSCHIKSTDAAGICTSIYECDLELNKRNRLMPEICSYEKFTPIVCCEPQNIIGERIENRISEKHCDEYQNLFKPIFTKRPDNVHFAVGGVNSAPFEFPHMAAIGWTKTKDTMNSSIEWKCGGSLISEKFILTAAHCTSDRGTPPDIIRLSEHQFSRPNNKFEQFQIAKIINHPDYKVPALYNDIALIELDGIVEFKKHLRPACLWQTPPINYTTATATGWGRTEYMGKSADILQKVELNLVANTACNDNFQVGRKLPRGIVDSQMCLGYPGGERDTCSGDSGGPVQVRNDDVETPGYRIIGITSFGIACGTPAPSVYTRVSYYIKWIESVVWPN